MKLNKEKSKKNIKLLLIALGVSIVIGEGIAIYDNNYFEKHIEYEKNQKEYRNNVNSANLDDFDLDFMYLCSNGRIKILGNDYLLKDLYISMGDVNSIEKVYIQDYKDASVNAIDGKKVDQNYKRNEIMPFIYSNAFYQLYSSIPYSNVLDINEDHYDNFINIMSSFDGTMHDKLPETYYATETSVIKSPR